MWIVLVAWPASICLAIERAALIGMAKDTPAAAWNRKLDDAAVSMPTTLPSVVTSGPPESPGCRGALVRISPLSCSPPPLASPAVTVWSNASTTPSTALGVPPAPRALPIPTTASPTTSVEESPMLTALSPEAPLSLRTATSSVRSVPTTSAA